MGKFIFKPLKKVFPEAISLLFTFIFCGLIHDAVTTVYRGKISFFFSIWFLFMALAVLMTRILKHNFSKQGWLVRASINLGIIAVCFIATIYSHRFLMAGF
ncbi:hypothetical protein DCC35_14075 [Mangrovivirga cuniculi]|uniref:Uncharacterized protein n=1 Tax=Mangrovivirga cuniculi TaxID=2715131 RepID=A0A4D7JLN2_9BACT|nr:hypothetical protein DCC35_14075 [Mangrovivirga cuniculi]